MNWVLHFTSRTGVAFVAAIAMAGSAIGGVDGSALDRSDDASERTSGARGDCEDTISARGCFACCETNDCADACRARLMPDVAFEMDDLDAVNGYLKDRLQDVDQNNAVSDFEFRTMEYISAAPESEALRRFALAVMAEAWRRGLISDHAEDVFVESFDAALVGDDFGIRSTAMALVLAEDIPVVNDAPVIQHLTEIVNSGAELEDEIGDARPLLDEAEVADRARDHRNHAARVLAKISGP